MKFRLSEKDAAALGCPREVEFAEDRLGAREVVAMQKQTGFTLDKIGWSLQGTIARGPDGMPLYEREDGVDKLDEQGERIPLRQMDMEAIVVAVWLAVRRAGAVVAYADFDFDFTGLEFVGEDEDPVGKVEPNRAERRSSARTSKASSRTTSPRSRTSSASAPGRSTS